VLRHDGARHHGLYPRLLNFAAVLAIRLGEVAEGRHYAIESLRASRQAGNRFTEAASRSTLSIAADELGRKGRTRRHLEAALAIYRELGDERYIANALVNLLGYIDHLHPTRASSVIREAEALLEKSPVPVLSAVLDLNRAHLLLRDRAYTEAIGASMRAIEFFGTTGNIESITVGWRNIAYALEGLEQFSAAARLVGSMRNLARHPEYRMRPKYEDSWMALEMRLRQRLGIRYEEYVLAGQASGPPDSTDLR
jgi:tetratricopeptide (TPR) repeat protein